jgi:hypothetical protein
MEGPEGRRFLSVPIYRTRLYSITCHIPEDHNPDNHCSENLKFDIGNGKRQILHLLAVKVRRGCGGTAVLIFNLSTRWG